MDTDGAHINSDLPPEGVRKKRVMVTDTTHAHEGVDEDQLRSENKKTDPSNLDDLSDDDDYGRSDDDDDGDDDDDEDEDVLRGMGLSKEERRKLMQMPELERELELTKRAQTKDDADFMKQLHARTAGNKEQAQSEGRDVRRSERKQASVSKQISKMESLKEMKASRHRQEQRKAAEDFDMDPQNEDAAEGEGARKASRSPSPGARSPWHRQDLEEAQQTYERGASNEPDSEIMQDAEDAEESEAGREDVLRMQVYRENLEDWIKHPHLQQNLKGAIVRVASSPGASSMWVVVDVVDGDSYQFGTTSRQHCDKYLRIQNPVVERLDTIPFSVVSNSPISMEEYHEYHEERAKAKLQQISKSEAAKVLEQLQRARDYVLSADDINKIVRDRKAKGLVKKSLMVQRAELILQRKAAEDLGDEEELSRVTEKLEDIIAKIKAKEAVEEDREKQQLAELDKKAMMANRARTGGKAQRGSAAAKNDPYSRKRTIEKVYWSTGQRQAAATAKADVVQTEQLQEKSFSRQDQLESWQLPTPAMPLSSNSLTFRRLLGCRPYRFSQQSSTHHSHQGRTCISLESYEELLQKEKYATLGLE